MPKSKIQNLLNAIDAFKGDKHYLCTPTFTQGSRPTGFNAQNIPTSEPTGVIEITVVVSGPDDRNAQETNT